MKEKIDKIIASAKPYEIPQNNCGVYLLYSNGEIVYVGKSKNILSRISTHFNCHKSRGGVETKKEFDKVTVIECEIDEMDFIERILIDFLLPKYNRDSMTKKQKRMIEERENRINDLLTKLK